MERLGLGEAAERLVDQGDVGFAEQLVDIFRSAQDDPVQRQFEQVAAGLDSRRRHRGAAQPSLSAWSSCTSSIRPRDRLPDQHSAEFRVPHPKNRAALKRLGGRAEHPVENRVDVLEMMVEVEQRFELSAERR